MIPFDSPRYLSIPKLAKPAGQRVGMMVTGIRLRGVRTVVLGVLFCAVVGSLSASDKLRINVRQSDDAIRQRLLQLTPPGTSAEAVFQFAQFRLHRESRVVGWPAKRPGSFMFTELGHYFELSVHSYLMFPTVVQAFWYFNDDDKLRDIRVRRFVRGW